VTLNDRKPVPVGTLVYRSYSPVQCGKVVKDLGFEGSSKFFRRVKVKWLKDGSETVESTASLKNFRSLIEDHQRKFEKFSKQALELEKL
jgi:hypothetical protein